MSFTIWVALNAPGSEEAEDEEALHTLLAPAVLHELSKSISTVTSVGVALVGSKLQLENAPLPCTTAFAQIVVCDVSLFKSYNLIGEW